MRGELCRMMLTLVALTLGIVLLLPALAQDPVPAGPRPATTIAEQAQLENYVNVMKAELERAEARVKAVTTQLVALDDDIESRVNRIVSLLSSVRDSAEGPNSRMRRAKEDALAGLKATAAYYAQERDRRKKDMGNRYAQIDDEALAEDVVALNKRIETRVAQSLEITASLVQHEESPVERYHDPDQGESTETREHRKLQRDAQASAKMKAEVAATLRASMEKLSRDVKAREAELSTTTDPKRKVQLAEDIKTMRQTIDIRRGQIEELVTAPRPSTRPVDGRGAFEMDKMLDEMTMELKADFAKFRVLVNERDTARARLKPLKDKLDQAITMLGSERLANP